MRDTPAVQTLRRVWVQQFFWEEGALCWRETDNRPADGDGINSPYDPEAQCAKKRETSWTGYKVHLTETCDDDLPHLMTHVETTSAPPSDLDAVPRIHKALQHHDLFPGMHIVDTGYVDAEQLVTSQRDFGGDLFGPTRNDYHWQAREDTGFAAEQFVVDWPNECAIFSPNASLSSLSQTP